MLQSIIVYTIAIIIIWSLASKSACGCAYMDCNTIVVRKSGFLSKSVVAIVVFFSLFCAVRYDVGADYLEYLNVYLNYDQYGDVISGENEYGFTFLFDVFNQLNLSPPFFFGFIAFLQILFFLIAFKQERFLWPWLLLFFFVDDGFLLWMNGMRQCLALCIWLVSLSFIEKKQPLWYCLLCFLASLIHSSSVFLVLLFPLLMSGKPLFKGMFWQYIIIIIAFAIRFFFNDILISIIFTFSDSAGLYGNYLDDITGFAEYGNTYLAYWFKLFIYCIIIYYSEGMREFYSSKRFNILYAIFFIGVISRCIIPFNMSIVARIFLYFTFLEPVMLAHFVYYLTMTKGKTDALRMMIIVSFVAIFYLNQIVSTKDSSVWYQFYFCQPINNIQ